MFSSTLFQSRRLSLEIQRHAVATKGAPLHCTGIDSLCPMLMKKIRKGFYAWLGTRAPLAHSFFGSNHAFARAVLLQASQERPLVHKKHTRRCGWGCCAFRDHVNNCRHATTAVCKYIRWESDPRASKVVSVASTEIGMLVGYSARSSAAPVVVGTAFET